ncbi:hypothetical protein ASE15_03395 [Oerskovia sp. Root22]|nr:hypothetical protein ASE15_03395 [Oerskovia sp. Root22]
MLKRFVSEGGEVSDERVASCSGIDGIDPPSRHRSCTAVVAEDRAPGAEGAHDVAACTVGDAPNLLVRCRGVHAKQGGDSGEFVLVDDEQVNVGHQLVEADRCRCGIPDHCGARGTRQPGGEA